MSNKMFLRIITACTAIVLFQACSPAINLYHSEASLPYKSSAIQTTFKLVELTKSGDGISFNAHPITFGVVSAKDNDQSKYVLIAPKPTSSSSSYPDKLNDVILYNSITLLPKDVDAFITILKNSSESWNAKHTDKTGVNYEFMIAPENKIIPQSTNVVTWHPSMTYNYQNNSSGPIAVLLVGDGAIRYIYKFEKQSHINDLINLLEKANN